MSGLRPLTIALLLLLAAATAPVAAQTPAPLALPSLSPIRGAHYPALSPDGKRLCFEYLGDLWIAPATGGTASRLTIHQAYDGYPHWSPDGRWIAFSSNREGNFDVYLVPARGGEARQLTFNTADDYALDWSPDGSEVLFSSARDTRFSDLYTVRVTDGRLRRVTDDQTQSRYGVFSPNGKTIAYARGRQEWWRPKYKGSANADIYTIPAAGGRTTRWTDYNGFDDFPLYAPNGKTLYFVSDRSGASNLWRVTTPLGKPVQLTHQTGDSVRFPTIARDGSRIAYECGFQIWTMPLGGGVRPSVSGVRSGSRTPNTEHPTPVSLFAPTDLLTNLRSRITFSSGAQSLRLSEDGKTFAFVAHGDLWTVPAGGGDAERVTKTGAAEYSPEWQADGARLAYTTDRNGNLDVYLLDLKTKAETQVTSDPADDTNPRFSPDGRLLAFVRTGGPTPGLYALPAPKSGDTVKPSDAVRVGPGSGVSAYDWSPDGRWLVYAKRDPTSMVDLWIVPAVGGTPVNVTRYPGINTNPQWSRDGRWIVFTSTRNSPPGAREANLYALRLLPAPQRDEDGAQSAIRNPQSAMPDDPGAQGRRRQRPQGAPQGAAPAASGPGLPATGVPARATEVRIDFEDIQDRARPLTNTRDAIRDATLSPDAHTVLYAMTAAGQTDWWIVDVNTGQTTRITNGAETGGQVEFAPDATRFYFLNEQGAIRSLARGSGTPTPVAFNAAMELDRRAEEQEAFNEAWRLLATQFYDPKFHGEDWHALRSKYEPLLAETEAKEDFAWLLEAMIGELNASHMAATPPAPEGPPAAQTAHLGLTFDQDYAGPGLKVKAVLPKGPCDQTGRHVEVGEYVLKIDGQDVSWNEAMYRALLDRAGKTTELLVNSKPTVDGAHVVRVRPVTRAQALDLEYEQWVAERRAMVDRLSGGTLAYIHIRAMDQPSLQRFERELFGDAQSKQGLVLDVRFNGGGRIHDELLDILARKPHVYEVPRDAPRSTQPFQVWDRPTILLINEYSASDAEIFPNGFRAYGLGKLVGVPTYGAVIGTRDVTLVDGTRFRIPTTGWYTLEGRNLEGYGVPPDIRVEMTPEDYAQDNDRQLQAAVRELMTEMAAKR